MVILTLVYGKSNAKSKIKLIMESISEFKMEIQRKGDFTNMLFAPKEKGQGLVEYALILVLVAIVVIAALMILGPIIGNTFSTINGSLNSAG
jgi:pilus assembly protein Flp/PilA